MTIEDFFFTLGDMEEMVRSSSLTGYVELMRQFQADPAELLKKYDISLKELDNPESLVSLSSVSELLEESAFITNCNSFGLELSNYQNIEVLGPISLVVQSASTIGKAIELGAKYLFVQSPGLILTINKKNSLIPNTIELGFKINLKRFVKTEQCLELCIADLHKILKVVAGYAYQPVCVAFPHEKKSNKYHDVFDCEVTYGQSKGGIYIYPELLEHPLKSTNQFYLEVAETYIRNHYVLNEESIKVKVSKLLLMLLSSGQASKEKISHLLAIHPRTLHRKLRKEGVSFEELKDHIRKKEIHKYLMHTSIPLDHIAEILGYSEQSSMTRACKRWFGKSPKTLRSQNHY